MNNELELPSEVKKIQAEQIENQVRNAMSMNRHQRRAMGKRNAVNAGIKKPLKIPSDRNYNFIDGVLKPKE